MISAQSRRKFISLSFFSGLFFATKKGKAMETTGETVSMLTREGKLVEVDRALISNSNQKKQATKKDILHWMHPGIQSKK